MAAEPILGVLLSDAALRYARPHVGADGARWRAAMATAGGRARRDSIDERGPRIEGDFLTLDVGLYEEALAALEIIAMQAMNRAALVRADLGELEDALVRAMRERTARERRGGGR
jgi:hypothetical protein